jgi:hypothetical protein
MRMVAALLSAGLISKIYIMKIEEYFNEGTPFESMKPALSKGAVSRWVAVTDALPKALQTVWLTNGKGWCCLGCLIEDAEGWHWAESNGVIYIENGEIVSECESEDLDVNFWHELPKPPCH